MSSILRDLVGHNKNIYDLLQSFKDKRLAHSLLFVGQNGIGKKKVALGLAQVLVCEKDLLSRDVGWACGECPSCRRVELVQSESLLFIEPKASQIKIEQSREILKFLSYKNIGESRVVIIDEVQCLNPQAGNALLKSIEEPPEGSYFILVANSSASILPTIRSRCQVVSFMPLNINELEELISAERWVLEASQGSVELAQNFLDNEVAELRKQAFLVWENLINEKFHESLSQLKELSTTKEISLTTSRFWQQIFRDALMLKIKPNFIVHRDYQDLLVGLEEKFGQSLLDLSGRAFTLEEEILGNSDRQLSFESFLYYTKDNYFS